MEELWKAKRNACRRSQRHKDDKQLREVAKTASWAFEKAASQEKERLYEVFSRTVTEDRTLHKFWQLHKAMNGNRELPSEGSRSLAESELKITTKLKYTTSEDT